MVVGLVKAVGMLGHGRTWSDMVGADLGVLNLEGGLARLMKVRVDRGLNQRDHTLFSLLGRLPRDSLLNLKVV